jgi:hypothetical protein
MNYLRRMQTERPILFWAVLALGFWIGFQVVLSVVAFVVPGQLSSVPVPAVPAPVPCWGGVPPCAPPPAPVPDTMSSRTVPFCVVVEAFTLSPTWNADSGAVLPLRTRCVLLVTV